MGLACGQGRGCGGAKGEIVVRLMLMLCDEYGVYYNRVGSPAAPEASLCCSVSASPSSRLHPTHTFK